MICSQREGSEFAQEKQSNQDTYKSLLFIYEISRGKSISSVIWAKDLILPTDLVDSYIAYLFSRCHIKIKAIPAKKYAFYLTPEGFHEKTRLTYQYLQNITNLLKVARRDFNKLFNKLSRFIIPGIVLTTENIYCLVKNQDGGSLARVEIWI